MRGASSNNRGGSINQRDGSNTRYNGLFREAWQ
jgi:hypothetical protein